MHPCHRSEQLKELMPTKKYWYRIITSAGSYLVASENRWEYFIDYVHNQTDDYSTDEDEDEEDEDNDNERESFDGEVTK